MASHDVRNAKTTILGATPREIPETDGNPHEKISFARAFSKRFFKNWGGPRAPDLRLFLGNSLVRPKRAKKFKVTLRGDSYACFKGYFWRVFKAR